MEELTTSERLSLANFCKLDNAGICLPTILIIAFVLATSILVVTDNYDTESLNYEIWEEPFFKGLANETLDSICESFDYYALIRQKVNAFASMSYTVVAMLCLGIALYDTTKRKAEKLGRRPSNPERTQVDTSPVLLFRQPLWSIVFALHFLFVGLANGFFHASLTIFALHLRQFSWWALGIFFTVYSIARLFSDGIPTNRNLCCEHTGVFCVIECHPKARRFGGLLFFFAAIAVAGIADMAMYMYLDTLLTDYEGIEVAGYVILTFLFFIPIVLHWYQRRQDIDSMWPLLVGAIGMFSLAVALRWFDSEKGFLCDSTSPAQGYAAWQVLGAIALFLVYLFFRGDIWRDELLWLSQDVELISVDRNRISFRDTSGRISTISRQRSPSSYRQSIEGDDLESVTSLERRAMNVMSPELVRMTRNLPAGRSVSQRSRSSSRSSRRSARQSRGTSLSRHSVRSGSERRSMQRRSQGSSGSSGRRGRSVSIADRLQELRRQREILEERNRQVRRSLQEKERLYELADVQVPTRLRTSLDNSSGISSVPSQDASGTNGTVAMWTCSHCRFADNELAHVHCVNCGESRPPLSSMVAVAQPVDEEGSALGTQASFSFRERGMSDL